MNTPLVMAAFGTTSKALATYQSIDRLVRRHFPSHPVFWAYSSRVVNSRLQAYGEEAFNHPLEMVRILREKGFRQAVIQSLHLLPGHEFHQLVRECRQAALPCHVGMPLLTSQHDYKKLTDCLAPMIESRPDKAILLVGHGTSHPSWIAYPALENIFRRRFGSRIFVGVLEKSPDSGSVPEEIVTAGFKQVCALPLLLVAGMHYERDIAGAGGNSWLTRLKRQGLEVESIAEGLGLQPGFREIVIDRIEETLLQAAQGASAHPGT